MFHKKLLILYISILFFSISWSQEYKKMMNDNTYTVQQVQQEAEKYFSANDKGKGSGYKQYKRWEYQALQLMDENGYLKENKYYIEALKQHRASSSKSMNTQLNDNWEELGPTNWNQLTGWNPGVGRLTSIAIDRNDTNHIIVGSDNGGVWKTTNEGANWTPLTDTESTLYVYSLAMDPTNTSTYYWGSTDGRVFKSTDSGLTWLALANAGGGKINKIIIHPTNSNVVFVSSDSNGIYKSTNGGFNWTQVVYDNYSQDVEFNTYNSNIVYASGRGFYKSSDLGNNFNQIGGFSNDAKMIGVSKADSNRVYVLEANGGKFGGFYMSTDGGYSFYKKYHLNKNYFGFSTVANDNLGQAPRDMDIAVSPNNANEVHIAGLLTWKSTNGGDSFVPTSDWQPGKAANKNLGYCHSDVDLLEFVGNSLYACTDGGVYIAENTSYVNANYFRDITTGLGIRAFYKLGISQTSPVVISGGAQDNGTSFYTPTRGWGDWLGADGMETFVDKNNPNILYGTSQGGVLYKTTNQGGNYQGITPYGKSGNWVTPFEQDPSQPNTIYAGYDAVYKSTDGGYNWGTISQNFGRNLAELKIAPSDNSVIYASDGYRLYKSNNTSYWGELTGFSGYINSIAIHPKDPNKIAIATGGGQKVYVSPNGGVSWTSYLKNLPDFSALALVWQDNDNDGLYLGMNYGIYYIDNTLTQWQDFNSKLPNVKISELEINTADDRIYAATYGRGVWSSPIVASLEGCLTTVKTPYTESYENTLGGWTQSKDDNTDWIIQTNGTYSQNTGPSSAADGAYYIYVEASKDDGNSYPNKRAILNSPCYDITSNSIISANFSFQYHMYGAVDMGTIDVEISRDEGASWTSVWHKEGNQGNIWKTASIDLSKYINSVIQLRFNRVTGGDHQSDLAIDDIKFTTEKDLGDCVTGDLSLTIKFDNDPEEISWSITDSVGTIVASKSYSTSYADESTVTETISDLKKGEYTGSHKYSGD